MFTIIGDSMNCKIHAESQDSIIEKNWPKGVKKTHQRIDIFLILYYSDEPLSAADIFEKLNLEHPKEKYAFSTVYRNLLAFEKAGMVIKSTISGKDDAIYELKKSTHKHYAICKSCGKMLPIKTCPLHDISKLVADSLPGFQITGHHLEIIGLCSECQ